MKNIRIVFYQSILPISYLFSFFVCFLFTSCEDLLEEKPKAVATSTFYQTSEEMEAGVFAIYAALGGNTRAEQVVVLDAHTEWGYGRGSRANYNSFSGFNSGNINVSGGRWNLFYSGIRNANIIIASSGNGADIDPAKLNAFVGEAKFLRALCYFDLVRNWGGVVLRTEQNISERDVPKSTAAEVYDFIIQDLLDAEVSLPEIPANIGRASRYAAKAMLADVYLNLNRFEEARDKANEVIASNKFSLVPVTTFQDFQQKIFGPTLLTSTEEIFSFKYTRQSGFGNFILWILNHPSTGLFNFGGAYAHYSDATNKFYVEWDDNDIRKSLWDQINFGLGPTTLVSKKYIDQSAASQNGAGNDIPIYRYPEVLLIYAEAACRVAGGPTADAMEALNKVHRRAYGNDPVSVSPDDFVLADYDEESFVDLVLMEKAYEFQFEGKRWYDLKRTGKAAATILDVRGITIADKHYLWPIPVNELELNKAMKPEDQNPGY